MKVINIKDKWESGEPYEYFMGRWSRLVARRFIDWLSPSPGLKWLDVGCGSGALSEAIVNKCQPSGLTAIDQSEGFIRITRKRLGNRVRCRTGNALALPLKDSSMNFTVSGLVLNFIPEPQKALAEMKRVTTHGGIVAVYIWDYPGKMDFLNHFWDAAIELDPEAARLHEGKRFPDTNAETLAQLFEETGFSKTVVTALEIDTHFRNFEDYWKPFLGGQGPAPTYLLSLDNSVRDRLRDILQKRLPTRTDGSIPLAARALAAKGVVP